jgi:hypothetical protein
MTTHRGMLRVTLAVGLGIGCGDGSANNGGNGGGGGGGGGGDGSGNITAQIDGQAFQSSAASDKAQVGPLGAITVQGTYANSSTITLMLYNVDQPGTYALGVGSAVVGGVGIVSSTSGQSWATPSSGSVGTAVLTTLTSPEHFPQRVARCQGVSKVPGGFRVISLTVLGTVERSSTGGT